MILRKPYAFLIRNFKLIHVIITICMIYLAYRTYLIYNYIVGFMKTSRLATQTDLTATLFNLQMFVIPGIIIICIGIILVVMARKKKPTLFYIVNCLIYGATIGVYSYLYNTINYIETNIISEQNLKLAHDIALMLFIAQIISMILTMIRATGFDIKKFGFGKDIVELDIDDADAEEFELNVNVETNVIKRNIKRQLRFARYIYLENKFLINTVIVVILGIIAFSTYMNVNIYNVAYSEGSQFLTEEFNMGVSNSYVTSEDYQGNRIISKTKTLVAIELSISALGTGQTLNTAKTELLIAGKTYFPVSSYRSSLFDLGKVYYNENVSTTSQKILLVYEIPTSVSHDSMQFKYVNDIEILKNKLDPIYIRVNLKPNYLDSKVNSSNISLGKKVTLNNDNLGSSTLKISAFDLNKTFDLKYNFCLSSSECYTSDEYLIAPLNANYDQVLLKITASFKKDSYIAITGLYNPYNLIDYFGSLTYVVDGKTYNSSAGFTDVIPYHTSSDNDYYIAVNANIMNASSIDLKLRIRNQEYIYKIK